MRRLKDQQGISLLEVLVALVMLSVGLLGSAGMLLAGLRDQAQALDVSAATGLVADAAERVRSHLQSGVAFTLAPGSAGAADLADFQQAADELLPHRAPQASILFLPATGPANPGRYLISLRLRDSDAQGEVAILKVPLTVFAQSPVAG
jgi:prepilin-type N-terminal cleavage/methylation domain-containing protein